MVFFSQLMVIGQNGHHGVSVTKAVVWANRYVNDGVQILCLRLEGVIVMA